MLVWNTWYRVGQGYQDKEGWTFIIRLPNRQKQKLAFVMYGFNERKCLGMYVPTNSGFCLTRDEGVGFWCFCSPAVTTSSKAQVFFFSSDVGKYSQQARI